MSKSKIVFASILLLFATVFSGCKKEDTTGDLIVNAIDGLNNSLGSGHTVYLYNNQADYNNAVYSKTRATDSNGQVKFEDLAPGVYFADCNWENSLGMTMTSSGSGSVSAGMVTTITIE